MCYTGTRTLLEKVINNMNKNLKGSIMVFIAGIAWGLSGVCGQFLMSRGMNVSQLISMRLLISGTVLTAIAATKYRELGESLAFKRSACRNFAFCSSRFFDEPVFLLSSN